MTAEFGIGDAALASVARQAGRQDLAERFAERAGGAPCFERGDRVGRGAAGGNAHHEVAGAHTGRREIVARAVGIGGVAVIGCFAPDGPEQCSGLDVRRASAEDLAALVAPAFAVERAERVEHTTPWGSVQPFTWVVLRRV